MIGDARRALPTTSANTRPLAIRFTQAFYCPLDGRVCSGKSDRLLGNELVRRGDLRTVNGILRRSRWSRIVDSLVLPLNRSQLCFKIAP